MDDLLRQRAVKMRNIRKHVLQHLRHTRFASSVDRCNFDGSQQIGNHPMNVGEIAMAGGRRYIKRRINVHLRQRLIQHTERLPGTVNLFEITHAWNGTKHKGHKLANSEPTSVGTETTVSPLLVGTGWGTVNGSRAA